MQVHLEKWPFKWSVYVYDITREELNSLVIEVLDFHWAQLLLVTE